MNESKSNGRKYWQSLSHLANTPQMQARLDTEFPGYDPEKLVNSSRRKFLQLAGASMALAGLTLNGCRRWPKENIAEQNSRPIGRIPGIPEQYATVWELGGVGQPLLVTTYDGRPIKVDGNPMHPATATFGGKLGASTVFAQATLLEMYDPERSRSILVKNQTGNARLVVDWTKFKGFVDQHFGPMKGQGGKLAVLTEQTRGPSNAAALAAFQAAYPQAKVYEYEPVSRDNELAASRTAFGTPARQLNDLSKAKVIVSFDADLFGDHPDSVRQINGWVQTRRTADTDKTMSRMYVVESRYSVTGTNADERLPASVRSIEQMVLQLASRAGLESGQAGLGKDEIEFVDKIWEDLKNAQGQAVIAGGYTLRPEVLGVIAALNDKLGSFGSTITLVPDVDRPTHVEAITNLVNSINSGGVDTLVILGGNPVYDAPADLGVREAIRKVPTSIHLSLYDNETSVETSWHVNRAHYLESWGDAVMFDGTVGIQQPMIEPLFGGKTVAEVLFLMAGEDLGCQDILYRVWGQRLNEKFVATSAALQKVLHDGWDRVPAKTFTPKSVARPSVGFEAAGGDNTFELRFAADPKVYDGRFANNGWLQECPAPVTKLTWDNAALISYADAQTLGVKSSEHDWDVLNIETPDGKSLKIPAFITPGQPKGVITLNLGYARKVAGSVVLSDRPGSIGSGVGYDTYSLRTSRTMWSLPGAKVTNTGERADLATTAGQYAIEPLGFEVRQARVGKKEQGGLVVHESTLAAYVKDPEAPHKQSEKLLQLQLFNPPYATDPKRPGGPQAFNEPHAWGMTIDMNACVGCNACVVACQAENNVPIVGKDEVIVTRAMHWLRIDSYFKGELGDPNPEITHQPMMCVHCENAPCEQVCPVAATVHDTEGLNTMVYNRCIGTRYCANNCPYKVRRFNYLDYHSRLPGQVRRPWLGIPDTEQNECVDKIEALHYNPEVTVRMRGVMEKCTYCVQRIKNVTNQRRIEWVNGRRDKPTVDDFDIVTACQVACPAEAIVFGNLNDPEALVTRLQKGARSYEVLEDLNNRPRTQHLAKLRNPVHEIDDGKGETA